ncbi:MULTISPECIES: cold-shock protein [Kordiimonas]|jgi:CspA family cold shock protein|uniref:Cold-shock DNA-binding protein family n=2 Tax=Kordiimonas TaxID=288021 RepID=A0A1G6UE98_9PROT|nr:MULTISPECIES: cold-shock protein [Kordiimonas]SDD39026.1 cold-shock DNA-binding protein family [Kordiimonas lacus]
MANGTVKWFNTTKGFGFIKPEDGGNDVFVHISALERAGLSGLEDNQPVSYELVEDRRGRMSAGELKLR